MLEENGPSNQRRRGSKFRRIGEFFKNVFSKQPRLSTKSYQRYSRGQCEEVEFATTVWENSLAEASAAPDQA